ncbi:MAG: right-handed parallel beta-helix repeat-containing protein [Prevotella sp.]|nr:right-handed parallel beta-helix repeat-containing protein [Prevotella sp.]
MKHLLISLYLLLAAHLSYAGEIVVNPGESLHEALRQAREWRRTNDPRCEGGITIRMEGRHYMQEPLFLRPEDSGTKDSPTIIKGEEGAVICGDQRQRHTQLWPKQGMERMIAFDTETRTITIPTPPEHIRSTRNTQRSTLEMVVHQRWAIAILRVKDMTVQGDKTVVSFMEPESRLEFEHPWPQPVIGGERGNSSFLLRTTEQHDGIEKLIIVDGANYVQFKDLTIENTCWNRPLHKGHVTLQGGFPLIDAYKLKENPGLPWDDGLENQAWVERPVSAVTVRNAHHVDFEGILFHHLAATALDYVYNVSDCTITGCGFEHIGGTAIMAGSFAESPMEVHHPYTHLAERCKNIKVHRNNFLWCGEEDWGAVAIGFGYVKDCTISENWVAHTNYSGICIGWGWTPLDTGMKNNRIIGNKVSDYACQLYDAGGIYTLSNQPNSLICDNEISQPAKAPYATNFRGFCIYLDARTDGFTIDNNKTAVSADRPDRLIRRDEIGDNHPGPNIIFKQ